MTTLCVSDRDVFLFLVDDLNPIGAETRSGYFECMQLTQAVIL